MAEGYAPSSNRADGCFVTSAGLVHHRLKTMRPKLAFDPGFSRDDMRAWQQRVRDKLEELLCFPDAAAVAPPQRVLSEEREGYRLERWELFPMPDCVVPVLVLVPDGAGASRPAPAVMCLPGSSSTKELLAGEPETVDGVGQNRHPEHNKMALWIVRNGMVAVAVDNPVTGELAGTPGSTWEERLAVCHYLLGMGWSYLGLSIFQKRAVLEWTKGLPFVDERRIALSGHSLGTEPGMMLAVLDPSVKAVVHNDFLCDVRQMGVATALRCDPVWHLLPGMKSWFDFPDMAASLAPRALLVSEGGHYKNLQKVQAAYAIAGGPENFEYHYLPSYHDAAQRHDDEGIPEGMTYDEFLKFSNVNVQAYEHYFKEELAIPWLKRVFAL